MAHARGLLWTIARGLLALIALPIHLLILAVRAMLPQVRSYRVRVERV